MTRVDALRARADARMKTRERTFSRDHDINSRDYTVGSHGV
jgi:hypothetical protein